VWTVRERRGRPRVRGRLFAAWLTLGTILVALTTFVMGRRDEARAPAAHVYVVVVDFRTGRPTDGNPVFTDVEVRNDGEFPILDPSVQLWNWGKPRRFTWRLRRLEGWLTSERKAWVNGSYVPAKSRTGVHRLCGLEDKTEIEGSPSPPIVLMFRDGNGRLWVRWPDGKLKRVTPSRWLA
jgi:hypothetical protein